MESNIVLSRYEIAKIVGLRALQLDNGSTPNVDVWDGDYSLHIAARELHERKLDVLVNRGGSYFSVKSARFPVDLENLLKTLDESF